MIKMYSYLLYYQINWITDHIYIVFLKEEEAIGDG